MENRENIVADYFKLRTLLNRTNFKSNEKTDIEFTLRRRAPDNFYFAAELKGIRNPNKIELCQKTDGISGSLQTILACFTWRNFAQIFSEKIFQTIPRIQR